MILNDQLLVRENYTKKSRLCATAADVDTFLSDLFGYHLSTLEHQAMQDVFEISIPKPGQHPTAQVRRKVVINPSQVLCDLEDGAEIPEGYREMGTIYRGTGMDRSVPVARYTFNSSEDPIHIYLYRVSSTESLPLSLVEELWQQYLDHMDHPYIPKAKVDLVPYLPSMVRGKNHAIGNKYRLKVNSESFAINTPEDLKFCLSTLLRHDISNYLSAFIDNAFHHLADFPKEKVSSPAIAFYADANQNIYVGGNGTNNARRLTYAGKFFPSYFSGLSGNVFSIIIGAFEEEIFSVLLLRI